MLNTRLWLEAATRDTTQGRAKKQGQILPKWLPAVGVTHPPVLEHHPGRHTAATALEPELSIRGERPMQTGDPARRRAAQRRAEDAKWDLWAESRPWRSYVWLHGVFKSLQAVVVFMTLHFPAWLL